MRLLLLGTVLLTSCSPNRIVEAIPTPPERLVCEPAGPRPAIPAEHKIDWSRVVTVPQARVEHDAYVRSIRSREGVITGYLVSIEDKLFTCAVNAQWRRDFEAGLRE